MGFEIFGGLVVNMMVGIVQFGGCVGFIGCVWDDQFGNIFSYDIWVVGVCFEILVVISGVIIVCCLIYVMFDVECIMCIFLGVFI